MLCLVTADGMKLMGENFICKTDGEKTQKNPVCLLSHFAALLLWFSKL
jgi:hypothetical protein